MTRMSNHRKHLKAIFGAQNIKVRDFSPFQLTLGSPRLWSYGEEYNMSKLNEPKDSSPM